MTKVIRDPGDDPQFKCTLDRSEGKRYSVLGPDPDDGTYAARDHEEDRQLGYGTREEMIALVERQPDDHLGEPNAFTS